MKRTAFRAILLVALHGWVLQTRAESDGFGGAEINYSHDSNFLASPADTPATPESYTTLSGYAGRYWPTQDERSALVLRGEAALVRQDRYTALDSTDFGAGAGYYHAFGLRHVVTASASALARRFSDSAFDSNTVSLRLGLKQKVSPTFFLREGIGAERSDVSSDAYSYSGRTLQGSVNWGPDRSTLLSLSVSLSARAYNGAPGAARRGRQIGAAWVRQFSEAAYVRAAIAQQNNETLGGAAYRGIVYSLTAGLSL